MRFTAVGCSRRRTADRIGGLRASGPRYPCSVHRLLEHGARSPETRRRRHFLELAGDRGRNRALELIEDWPGQTPSARSAATTPTAGTAAAGTDSSVRRRDLFVVLVDHRRASQGDAGDGQPDYDDERNEISTALYVSHGPQT